MFIYVYVIVVFVRSMIELLYQQVDVETMKSRWELLNHFLRLLTMLFVDISSTFQQL